MKAPCHHDVGSGAFAPMQTEIAYRGTLFLYIAPSQSELYEFPNMIICVNDGYGCDDLEDHSACRNSGIDFFWSRARVNLGSSVGDSLYKDAEAGGVSVDVLCLFVVDHGKRGYLCCHLESSHSLSGFI